jgi:ATP-dependent helicase/nuclease subunit A
MKNRRETVFEPVRVLDQGQRQRALDPSQSFIVQAPAGSGKTELLIQRFLALLARVDQPESVVALTFTRKAAGEMRHRVIEAMRGVDTPEPESSHQKHTRTLALAVLAHDEALDWQLIEHPSRLRIQTIDSQCAALVRQMPWVSRLGAPPRPEENIDHLYRRAARQTLDLLETDNAMARGLKTLLGHLDNNMSTVETLLSTMLLRRDQWLRHVVGTGPEAEFRASLDSALEQVVRDELEGIRQAFPEGLGAETIDLASYAAGNLIAVGTESVITNCTELTALPGNQDRDAWLGLAELFLTKVGKRRKKVDKNQGFPPGQEAAPEKERWEKLVFSDAIVERLHALRSLPPESIGETHWEILRGLMALLPVAAAELRLVFQSEAQVDFTEIAHAAQLALGPTEAPTDLAFALDCRIEHLLVDEFQDTSQTQYGLLVRLTEEWQPGDGRTIFLVGDPMQSIYRFREAEVALFLRARRSGLGKIPLQPLVLSVNFRSTPEIVEWINEGIGPAFPEVEDTFTGAVEYEPSIAFTGTRDSGRLADEGADDADRATASTGGVTIHPFFDREFEPEARCVLQVIRETREADPQGTIAVLVRARTHLAAIVAELRREGVGFQAVDIDALGERPVVQDLLALTRALLGPADRIAWLAILRAPWCGLTLADLHTLAGRDFSSSIWDLINDPERRAALSDEGRRRLGGLVEVLADALGKRPRLPVRRWVEGVWVALGGPACLADRTDLEDAGAYLDLLESSTTGVDLRNEAKFTSDVARLFARPDVEAPINEDGKVTLQLLTVHKAKGLEFDTVILPGLGRRARGESASLMRWLEYVDGQGQSRQLLAPVKEAGLTHDPLYEYLGSVGSRKQDHEATRMLYVAATRARKRLHLLGHTPPDKKGDGLSRPARGSLLSKVWHAVGSEFDDAFRMRPELGNEEIDKEGSGAKGIPLRRLSADWSAPPMMSDLGWSRHATGGFVPADDEDAEDALVHPTFDWASELQRRVGIVAHAMLQRMRLDGRLDPTMETIVSALVSEGLDGEKLREGARRVDAALKGTVSDNRGMWILSEHDDDRREFALTGVIDGRPQNVVIDRTFVDDGVRWIIDYKSGSHAGGGLDAFLDNEQVRYRPQLERYGQLMKHLDRRPIRLALYFPMLQGWREWRFEGANG